MSPAPITMTGRICVAGVGGGGGHIIGRMAHCWPEGTSPAVVAINTDGAALDAAQATAKVQIGEDLTRGLGAGGDAKVGRHAAEDEYSALCALFENKDLALIVACLGGGTGTGAAPVVARAAHEAGALVMAVAVLPFDFEGTQTRQTAEAGFAELRAEADAVIVIPNQRLLSQIGAGTAAADVFTRANDILCGGIAGIWKMMTTGGLMSLNLADFRAALQHGSATMVFGYGRAEGPDRAQRAVEAARHSPLLDEGRVLAAAESLLVSVVVGADVAFGEVQQVMAAVTAAVRPDAQIRWGPAVDPSIPGTVEVTLVAPAGADLEAYGEGLEPAESERASNGKTAEGRATQTDLKLDAAGKGRFKDVEPTLHKGENLDIPTYLRRGIVIGK